VIERFGFLAKRFVAGETIASAIEAVRSLNARGIDATIDFLGEDILERSDAHATRDVYFALIEAIAAAKLRTNLSLKLTALGLAIDERLADENLLAILERAAGNDDPFVRIDMEGSTRTTQTLAAFERAYAVHKNVGPVLQAYLKRTPQDVERTIALGARVRLCKGAYNEPATIALKTSREIGAAYLDCAQRLLEAGTYPGIATHDRQLIAAVKSFVEQRGIGRDRFEFQMLYGCRPSLQEELIAQGFRLRVYVPFGTHWASYFRRRVLERRENLLFALSAIFGS
jgi:proline dehydrogenase